MDKSELRPRGRKSTIESHPRLRLIEYTTWACGASVAARHFGISPRVLYNHRSKRLARDPFYFVHLPPLESNADIKTFARIIIGEFAPQDAAA